MAEEMARRREAREVKSRKRRAREGRGVERREKVAGVDVGVEEEVVVEAEGEVEAAEEEEVSNSSRPLTMHSPLRPFALVVVSHQRAMRPIRLSAVARQAKRHS